MTSIAWRLFGAALGLLLILGAGLAVVDDLEQRGGAQARTAAATAREQEHATMAAVAASAAASAAADTARARAEQQEARHDAQNAEARRRAAIAAGDARDRELLDQLDAYAAAARGRCGADDRPAAAGGAPADDPVGLLAPLLREVDGLADQFAREADANRIAGRLCERSYDALTPAARRAELPETAPSAPVDAGASAPY